MRTRVFAFHKRAKVAVQSRNVARPSRLPPAEQLHIMVCVCVRRAEGVCAKEMKRQKRGRKGSDILALPHTLCVCRQADVRLGDAVKRETCSPLGPTAASALPPSHRMAKNHLAEAPLRGPAAKPLLKRRCHSDVSTRHQTEVSFASRPV